MKILSLFDGISCAKVALKRARIKVDSYYASEIDKYAITVSKMNHPEIHQIGDVKQVTKRKMEKIDLLIGGSPCQDLSIAKKNRKGLDGERSGLFWEYVRILKKVKPKYFVLENVASMSKEARDVITKTLGVEPIMINAALVSAQQRKRLFWTNIPGVKLPKDKNIFLKDVLEEFTDTDRLKSYCIDANYYKGASWEQYKKKGRRQLVLQKNGTEKLKSNTIRTSGRGSGIDDKHNWDTIRIGQFGKGGQGDRIYSTDGKSVGLSALGGGRGAKTGLYVVALTEKRTEEAKKLRREHKAKTGKDFSPRRMKELGPRTDGKTNTITTGITKESLILQDSIIRKLTPIECERLQGLPDNYTGGGTSDSQRYKMLGNAFNVDVVAHILSFIPKK